MAGWNKVQAEHGLVPLHSPAYTVGKNSSDIALVIDAMDLMHTGRFDGFVLVSSDSDFTRLASRIREQGLDVYGIGQQKTPEAFRRVCKRFIFLENLAGTAPAPKPTPPGQRPTPPEKAEAAPPPCRPRAPLTEARDIILRAMDAIDQEDEWFALGPWASTSPQPTPTSTPAPTARRSSRTSCRTSGSSRPSAARRTSS
jgi:hypothetical protein